MEFAPKLEEWALIVHAGVRKGKEEGKRVGKSRVALRPEADLLPPFRGYAVSLERRFAAGAS